MPSPRAELIAEDVTFGWVPNQPILNELSFNLRQGELKVVWGANGSGKTTLGYILAGIIKPQRGEVRLSPMGKSSLTVGLVMQNPYAQLFGGKVEEEVALGLCNRGLDKEEVVRRVRKILDEVGILDIYDRPSHQLSEGEAMFTVLASILVLEPQFLILDEVFSYLDCAERASLWRLVSELSHTLGILVLTARQWPELKESHLYKLERGKLESSPGDPKSTVMLRSPVR